MKTLHLIQPRHNYASDPKECKLGHVYLPVSLLTVAARLIRAGVKVTLQDQNINQNPVDADIVGINLLGAPYIPDTIKLQKEIAQNREDIKFILGGQVVAGLTNDQFSRLFGEDAVRGNDDEALAEALSINPSLMPAPHETSLIPAYKLIPDEEMKEYLSREFSLYVSQGCKFGCEFCPAVCKTAEKYRNIDLIEEEFHYLIGRAQKLGIQSFSIYMSNLDVFQTPDKLLEFARMIKRVKSVHPDFDIKFHGLSTVDSFLKAKDKNPEVIEELIEAGFHTVGFGVDGMTYAVWKELKKGHNTEEKCIEAIRSAREDFGLTPEILMVFGHRGVDTEDTLRAAYEFTVDMVSKYGAVPRPHVAKAFVPGNAGWRSPENVDAIEEFINHPQSFQALDFTALPNRLTHPDEEIRKLATEYFLKICNIAGNTTLYTLPILPEHSEEEVENIREFNKDRFDH